jgi:hypothetical protein
MARIGDGTAPPPRREDWNHPGNLREALVFVRGYASVREQVNRA